MDILYISHLKGAIANGLSWSVPASVKAQEKIDNVLWLNTSEAELPHWWETKAFTKSSSLKNLNKVKAPFNHPDLVVFEGFYDDINDVILGWWLKKKGIPYIIIPRSALTYQAMNNHAKYKKKIAHWLFYNRFIRNALAIQYLTNKEFNDSKIMYDKKSFVIPNGINKPNNIIQYHQKNSIKGIFIGRIDIYQKGLDILLEAIEIKRELLLAHGFTLDIYGPDNADFNKVNKIIVQRKLNNIVFLRGEISGNAKNKALLNSDVFFLTSRFEGHPMGLIEALAYGLPCFITPGTNIAEEIKQFDSGWIADFSVSSISEKIQQMIQEKSKYENLGRNAIKLSSIYSWDKLAKLFHDQIINLLSTVNNK